jgi:hypothetical protein
MTLTYSSEYDQVVGQVVTEEGKCLYQYQYVCYGQSLNFTPDTRKKPEAKYYDFYFHDRITNHFDNKAIDMGSRTTRFIELIKQAGAAPNSQIDYIRKNDLPAGINSRFARTGMIRIRHDLDKCTAQEMFLLGSCIRTISNSPQLVLDYLQLVDLHPDIELSLLYQIACSVSFKTNRREQSGSNVLIDQSSGLLRGKTFTDFYNDVAKYGKPMLRISTSYLYPTPQFNSYQKYFQDTDTKIKYKHPYSESALITSFIRNYGAKYSPETVYAALDKDKATELFYTNKWCRRPLQKFEIKQPEMEIA